MNPVTRWFATLAAALVLSAAIYGASLIPREVAGQTGPLPNTQCVSTAIASGTGDAIAIPLLPCTETTTLLILTITHANTIAAPTISVNGQTPHVVKNFDESALTVGFLQTDQRRLLTYNGINWLVLNGSGDTVGCIIATGSTIGCVQPDNTTITINGSGVISAVVPAVTCAALPGGTCPFDINVAVSGVPDDGQIINVPIGRTVSCPTGFTGSYGYASTASGASAAVTVNEVTAGTPTARGAITFATSVNGTPSSAAGMSLVSGEVVQFVFPSPADSTLANIGVLVKCTRSN